MLKSYLFGVLTAFLTAVLCLFLFAFICVSGDDPRALTGLFGIIAFLLGGVAGGFVSSFLNKGAPAVSALAVSGTYVAAVFILSWCNRNDTSRPLWQAMLLCLAVLGASFAVAAAVSARTGSAGNTRKKLHKRIMKR